MSETSGAAEAALSAALPAENQPSEAAPFTPSEPNVPSGTAPVNAGAPAEPASKEVDISHLPEEAQIYLRARERELQGDATRKWQEAAELRREAEQSIAFVQALNEDPNFAREVNQYLNSSLSAAGYVDESGGFDDTDFFEDDGPSPYQAEINELKAWRDNMEQQMLIDRISADLDHQIARVRAENPTWDDGDIQAIIDLGFATQGNIHAAAEAYRGMQDRTLTAYLDRKGSVSAPPVVRGSQGTPVPETLKSATDEELRQAALERIRQELG